MLIIYNWFNLTNLIQVKYKLVLYNSYLHSITLLLIYHIDTFLVINYKYKEFSLVNKKGINSYSIREDLNCIRLIEAKTCYVYQSKKNFIIEKQILDILCNTTNIYQTPLSFYTTQIINLIFLFQTSQPIMRKSRNFSQS